MFQHIVTAWRIHRGCMFANVRTRKTRFDTTTKFMVFVTSLFNLLWWFHAVDILLRFQQHCPSLFVHEAMKSLFQHAWTSLSTTLFKLAYSTMFKLASSTMHVQTGQINHVQVCQQAKTSCAFSRVTWWENVFYKSNEGTVAIDTNIYFNLQVILKNVTF